MAGWMVVVAGVAANILVLVALVVLDSRMLPVATRWRAAMISGASALTGIVAWLMLAPIVAPAVPGALYLPIAALAAVAAFLATLAARSGGTVATLVFGAVWSAAVFVPCAALAFSALPGPFGLTPVDHGGSLAVNVAGGAAALGVLLAGGEQSRRVRWASPRRSTAAGALVMLTIGWIGWLVVAEVAIDEMTPGIVLNGVVAAFGGAAGWLAVQRIRHQLNTLAAVGYGLVCGLVSVTAGAPLFTPISAAAAGLIAGAAASAFTIDRIGPSRRQQWLIVGRHLIAGGTGMLMLGVLASGLGFAFTGQLLFIRNQMLSVALIAVYSTAVSFLLWSVLQKFVVKSRLRPVAVS